MIVKNSLRILSYNIHKGVSYIQRQQILERIKELIREVRADVVFLQEIHGPGRLGLHHLQGVEEFSSQLEYLADSVWPHFAYGKNAIYEDGNHGNAILSKFPIHQWSNLDISTNAFEKRGLLHVSVVHPVYKDLHLVCLHLNLLSGGRNLQFDRLVDKISRDLPEGPLVMAGDFNDWHLGARKRFQKPLRLQEAFHSLSGKYARSFPSFFPFLCLDRIYFRELIPISAFVLKGYPWNRLSDHTPLLAEFHFSHF